MSADPYRLLVVANRTCPCPGLPESLRAQAGDRPVVAHVVAPAMTSRLKYWVSDLDDGIEAARARVEVAVELLDDAGIRATGDVGDADPLLAIQDALSQFPADAVVISTWPEGVSNWLERGLIEKARDELDVDVHHVVSRFDAPVAAGA